MNRPKPHPPITRETLLRLIAFDGRTIGQCANGDLDDNIELLHENLTVILALALIGFDRVVPPISVAQTERGIEIVVGFPAVASGGEGSPWP